MSVEIESFSLYSSLCLVQTFIFSECTEMHLAEVEVEWEIVADHVVQEVGSFTD